MLCFNMICYSLLPESSVAPLGTRILTLPTLRTPPTVVIDSVTEDSIATEGSVATESVARTLAQSVTIDSVTDPVSSPSCVDQVTVIQECYVWRCIHGAWQNTSVVANDSNCCAFWEDGCNPGPATNGSITLASNGSFSESATTGLLCTCLACTAHFL